MCWLGREIKCWLISLVVVSAFFSSSSIAQDADAVLTIDGRSYNITNWGWGASFPATHGGGGGGSGIATIGDLEIEFTSNRLTLDLFDLIARGIRPQEVQFTDGNITLELDDVLVAGVFATKPNKHTAQLSFGVYTYTVGGNSICFDLRTNNSC